MKSGFIIGRRKFVDGGGMLEERVETRAGEMVFQELSTALGQLKGTEHELIGQG